MTFPHDYYERVYAGVLGKMIGVYLGRPFEGWSYEKITAELGEIDRYVHEQLGLPLIVTDDDLTGTFTFIRTLEDHQAGRAITPKQIGQTWLNYVLEGKTIFWWGGMGNSTEHTAFLRLKQGYVPPDSGSAKVNGKIVAEQIGAQIFIDGWSMVAPGDPELAAELARRAASVSHDGEAIYAAQVVAAMEALAFVESDRYKLIDTAVRLISRDSVIYRLVQELLEQYAKQPDWRKTRRWIVENYGYQKYIGGCHVVPNHALILLGLLYGEDDFSRTLMITNTSGWDTDCNSGNIGCLMGIKLGLEGIDRSAYDWRGPVSDRLLLPTADGGSAISDGLREATRITNIGRALAGEPPLQPKDGARFNFSLPGSVQGFRLEAGEPSIGASLDNALLDPKTGRRALALRFQDLEIGQPVRTTTATFMLPEDWKMPGYALLATPTLYSGQIVRAAVAADRENTAPVQVRLFLRYYDRNDLPQKVDGDLVCLDTGERTDITWLIPDLFGQPIFEIGLEVQGEGTTGVVYLDFLTWAGATNQTFRQAPGKGVLWRSAWVDNMDQWEKYGAAFHGIQNRGRGMILTGTSDWQDYRLSVPLTAVMGKALGIGARVQGLSRFYGLMLYEGGKLRLIKAMEEGDCVLGEADFAWELWSRHTLELEVRGSRITAMVDGVLYFDVVDRDRPLTSGGIALIAEEGHFLVDEVAVSS